MGNGSSVCFWEDEWAGEILAEKYPRIASQAKSTTTSVKEIVQADDLDTIFFLPLSQEAMDELIQVQLMVENIPYDESSNDTWHTGWGVIY